MGVPRISSNCWWCWDEMAVTRVLKYRYDLVSLIVGYAHSSRLCLWPSLLIFFLNVSHVFEGENTPFTQATEGWDRSCSFHPPQVAFATSL